MRETDRAWIGSLAQASARRPKVTIALWALVLVAAGTFISTLMGDAITGEDGFVNNPEAKQAQTLVEDRLRGPHEAVEIVVVRSTGLRADDPAFRAFVVQMEEDLARLRPDVIRSVTSFYDAGEAAMVSGDRDSVIVRVVMAGTSDTAKENVEKVHDVTIDRPRPAGFEVAEVGEATLNQDFATLSEKDLQKETVGLPVALIVLLVVFGAVVAAALPIVLGIVAIAVALGGVALIGLAFDFSFFVVNMITMMGLAVGIDYSLFIVSRYREERLRGLTPQEAIAATSRTASRAVFFSAVTVVLALLGMLLIPTTIFRSLAGGAILVVIATLAASLTLLPAVLSLLGDRVDRLRVPRRRRQSRADQAGGIWDRATRGVMRRPVVSVVVAAGALLAAAVPLLSIRTGFSGVSTLPDTTQSKHGFTVLSQEFAGGLVQPAEVVVDGPVRTPAVRQAIEGFQAALSSDGRFGSATLEINQSGDLAVVSVPIKADPSSSAASRAVRALRSDYVPRAFENVGATVLVGGNTAYNVDFFAMTRRYTPVVFAFVLGLSFLLLLVVFRSVVVPLKAILMNLLSVSAAYGLIVFVNQQGHGAGILGFQRVETVEAWRPLFLFSVLFGLSMDYHVFLLSRIKECYDQTGDNTEAVSFGVRSTAGIITGAALIMVAVFAGFAMGDLTMFQQMGFGLAVAVLLDATVVRVVLVPASMRLLGDRNWYLPRWLAWLPTVHIEATGEEREPAEVDLRTETARDGRPVGAPEPMATHTSGS
jgi:RND superfamily putative drug exporter